MASRISDATRKGIIDQLVQIGQVPGTGSYRSFFQRVFPKATEIPRNGTTLLSEIARHCDAFPGDWGDDAGMFDVVDIFQWTDQEFLFFCNEYVNPVFNRFVLDQESGERIDLQPFCVEAINLYLKDCGYELRPSKRTGDKIEYELQELSGVRGTINNIVFAAIHKPDIVLTDVLSGTIQIPNNEDKYLLYDEIISVSVLTWGALNEWYAKKHPQNGQNLTTRLYDAVKNCGSPIEDQFFTYYLELVEKYGDCIPALLPQVYLYYDPKAQRERTIRIFDHQCMDFLMLFSASQRVVIELDGAQHYSEEQVLPGLDKPYKIASPAKYANMVSAHREMTLAGYEVYRFGGKEFQDDIQAREMTYKFFEDLFVKHGIELYDSD